MFDIDEYVASRAVRVEAWKHRLAVPAWTAEPNPGHLALVELEAAGPADRPDHAERRRAAPEGRLVTGAGPRAARHGLVRRLPRLRRRIPMADVLPRLEAGDEDPACEVCGGILKSATVSFGQSLDRRVLDAAVAATEAADLFLAVGTSLQVYPAAGLCDSP